jgi:hypothetical protein
MSMTASDILGNADAFRRAYPSWPQPEERPMSDATPEARKHLVLHVEIPGFYADDLDQCAGVLSEPDAPGPEDRLYIVTEEWMRAEVGITLVGLPGEKCLSDDFEVRAFTGRIVGAESRDEED